MLNGVQVVTPLDCVPVSRWWPKDVPKRHFWHQVSLLNCLGNLDRLTLAVNQLISKRDTNDCTINSAGYSKQ